MLDQLKENIKKVIIGKDNTIELLLVGLLAEGHILLEDVPGLGKTKIARSLAVSLGGEFRRVQFTPDLQPADITGLYYYNQKEREFEFRAGPVFCNILLADEINRAVPRTQASLLEVMQERQVTVEGNTFALEEPFLVVATQNPVELEGTFPLPEAQLDRFLLKVELGYPEEDDEKKILYRFKKKDPLEELEAVTTPEQLTQARQEIKNIKVGEAVADYIVRLSRATRQKEEIELGLSPRASLSLMKAAMALAYIRKRDFVIPDDIKELFPAAAEHRLILSDEAELKDHSVKEIIKEILSEIEVPVEGNLNG